MVVGTTLGRKECSGQGPGVQGKDLLTKCMCVCAHPQVYVGRRQCAGRTVCAKELCVPINM